MEIAPKDEAGLRILIVDDDVGTCETLGDVLRARGQVVLAATSGGEGLRMLARHPVDVAIVDIKLPDMSGLELLDAIKEASPHTVVIFVTAHASIDTAIQAVNRAAFAYIEKPFEMDHVLSTIRGGLEGANLARALHESEERYRLVTEHIHDAVFLLDLEGRVTFATPRIEELTGYRLDELVGQPLSLMLTPEGARAAAARLATVRGGQDAPFFYETELVRKDGTTLVIEVNATSVRKDGVIVARLKTARDITKRKQAENELQQSEERFRATFEQAAVGMGYTTLEGRWVRVNQRLCEMVGYSRDELLELTFQDITHPDDHDVDRVAQRQLVANEIQTLTREKRYLHKNGSIVWIDLTVSIMHEISGPAKYFMAVIQDITVSKQREQELLHAQRMEGLGQLAGGIAHDFNNLLTVIGGRSYLLLAGLPADGPLHRDAELIQETADRAAALTRQLLAFSRKQILQPRVVEPNDLVQNATSLLTRLIGEDITLVFVPGSDLGRVRVDPGQLEQVIMNIAVNARDAMPHGGRLTVETSNVVVNARYAAQHVGVETGPYVMMAVSDTGAGMDLATQARIFEPFFTTKEPGKGTGLGLATVYGIVRQSGGHIRVYSEPGVGTTFRIYLPRTDAVLEETASADGALPQGLETLLIVEDEEEVRLYAREVLERAGYMVLGATDGGDAIRISGRHIGAIDMLLTDVVMPQMSGRDLAAAIAAARPETKILFMSGYTDDAIVRHGVLERDLQFLEKPFSPQALTVKVREVLDRE